MDWIAIIISISLFGSFALDYYFSEKVLKKELEFKEKQIELLQIQINEIYDRMNTDV